MALRENHAAMVKLLEIRDAKSENTIGRKK